ncbi:MAG: ABC transporter ATP-binding protein, partial [Proteobacteria bacterium]|nr:ABC transporter ATP-binding protein [Pseudomonadota bacterium]
TEDGVLVAVSDVSFSVSCGEVFGLLGPNGAGKTTVMRMLAGLIKPTSGTAILCGHDVRQIPDRVRVNLGYLSSTSGLPPRLSCTEVLRLFAEIQQVERPAEAVERVVERFGISEFAKRRVENLSTGMRQRVRIACAAVHEPPVLIMDEPTAGLDILAADKLLDDILLIRQQGAAVIFSTHVLREAARICDRIAIIHDGRILAEATLQGLLDQTNKTSLDEAFLALVRS